MKKTKQNQKQVELSDAPSVRDNLLHKKQKNTDEKQSISVEMRSLSDSYRTSTIRSSFTEQTKKRTSSKVHVISKKVSVMPSQFSVSSKLGNNQSQQGNTKQNNYDIWDLTYTLMSVRIPIIIGSIFFILFVLIRYYTMACLIYVTTQSHDQDILWILIVVVDRLLYMLLVIKISLQIPQTRTQIVLKSHWNSTQSNISELFSVIDTKKLLISILRGLIPAQLAFIYIKAQPRRRFQLYAAINYINSSIQAVLYYPFFIAYCSILSVDNSFSLNKIYQNFTICLAILAEIIMIIVTIGLIFLGIRKKYGKILYWL